MMRKVEGQDMMKYSGIILLLVLMMWSCGKSETPTSAPSDDTTYEPPVVDEPNITGTIRNISSMELVAEMGIGWNLGNSFDVRDKDKTAWGNPLPNKSIIDAVRAFGFKTIRIPVTWNFNQLQGFPYSIDVPYLNQVQEIVDYGLENKMHVIINTHHDDWVHPTNADATTVNSRLKETWTQIAEKFKPYGDSLIFEVLNEPRLMGSPEEWSGGTSEGRAVLNDFHKTCVDAIRATGANNEKRHIMIATYAASTVPVAMDELVIPNDDPNVIISLHSYFPWSFAGEANQSWGSDNDKQALATELEKIKNKWIVEEQRPVILGEWGSINRNSQTDQIAYASFYVKEAVNRGLLPVVWDDGGDFQLFDRNGLAWANREIAQAIIDAAE